MNADLDETFRLALMEVGPNAGLVAIARAVRQCDPTASTSDLARLQAKYVGFDGRILPTHDYVTGERR